MTLSASVGLRRKRLPLHTVYLLTTPSCPSSPSPATMADEEDQRDADKLWKKKQCIQMKMTEAVGTSNSADKTCSFYVIILTLYTAIRT